MYGTESLLGNHAPSLEVLRDGLTPNAEGLDVGADRRVDGVERAGDGHEVRDVRVLLERRLEIAARDRLARAAEEERSTR